MAAIPRDWRGLKNRFLTCPQGIQKYFAHLPRLLEEFPLDVSMGYLFTKIETAQNVTRYCGVLKLHQAHRDVASSVVQSHHLSRDGFLRLFQVVFGKELDPNAARKLGEAEKVRDKTIHGKWVKPAEHRKAIVRVIEYSELFSKQVQSLGGFKPFGDLRGFKGATKPLKKPTTQWVLKGMGFNCS